ncbi:hypothetical protein Hanom_Chr01g00056011 [Helianthus anomalus]
MTIKKAMMEVLVIGMAVTSETNSGDSTMGSSKITSPFYTVSLVTIIYNNI